MSLILQLVNYDFNSSYALELHINTYNTGDTPCKIGRNDRNGGLHMSEHLFTRT